MDSTTTAVIGLPGTQVVRESPATTEGLAVGVFGFAGMRAAAARRFAAGRPLREDATTEGLVARPSGAQGSPEISIGPAIEISEAPPACRRTRAPRSQARTPRVGARR